MPVIHEDIDIERRKPDDQATTQSPATSSQRIEIPVKSEEVEVTKIQYVKEEVEVKKKPVVETEKFSEEVKLEDTLMIVMIINLN